MDTQDFIQMIHNVCLDLLPIGLFVLVVYLIMFLKKLIGTMKTLDTTLQTSTKMIENCDKQVSKLDAPLATVGELSQTIDQVHEVSKTALTSALVVLINNLTSIKDYLLNKVMPNEETEIVVDDEQLEA